jgi:starch synthase
VDGYLAAHYSPDDLEGKRLCRADLLHAFGLEGAEETTPVAGIVSRFVPQKGFGLTEGAGAFTGCGKRSL